MFQWRKVPRATVVPQDHARDTLLCPRPGPLKTAGASRWLVQLESDSEEGQPRGTG